MPATASSIYVCRPFRATDLCAVVHLERRVQWDADDPNSWSWAHYGDWYRMPHSTHHIRVVHDVTEQKIWAACCFVESKDEVIIHNVLNISLDAAREMERWLKAYAGERTLTYDCQGGPVNG